MNAADMNKLKQQRATGGFISGAPIEATPTKHEEPEAAPSLEAEPTDASQQSQHSADQSGDAAEHTHTEATSHEEEAAATPQAGTAAPLVLTFENKERRTRSKRILLSFYPDDYEAVKAAAEAAGVSFNEWATAAINTVLGRPIR